MSRLRLYLEPSALQRPLDDLQDVVTRTEAACVMMLVRLAASGRVDLVWSEMLDVELAKAPVERVSWARIVRSLSVERHATSDVTIRRPRALVSGVGLDPADALHVASAEACAATMVTTDQAIVDRVAKHAGTVGFEVLDPFTAASRARRRR
jgi:predicted nucleic acid-binding protein